MLKVSSDANKSFCSNYLTPSLPKKYKAEGWPHTSLNQQYPVCCYSAQAKFKKAHGKQCFFFFSV